jgi:hypothetical protein
VGSKAPSCTTPWKTCTLRSLQMRLNPPMKLHKVFSSIALDRKFSTKQHNHSISTILQVFMVEHIHWSIATKCGLNQITIIQNRSEHCVDCVQCPKGMGSIPQCGSFLTRNTTVTCKACVKGVSYSESHDHTSCKQCRICVENEEVIKNCTATSDSECGECKPG